MAEINDSGTTEAEVDIVLGGKIDSEWDAEFQEKADNLAIQTGKPSRVRIIDNDGKIVKEYTGTPKPGTKTIVDDKVPPESDSAQTEEVYNDEAASEINETSEAQAASDNSNIDNTTLSGKDYDDDPGASAMSPGISLSFSGVSVSFKFGPIRALGGLIPSMESILLGVPNALIGKFMQGLPAEFQTLLPAGAVQGIVGAVVNTAISGGTVSLNNLLRSVAGVAIGSVANQALRSLQTSISVPVVSEISGALSSIALNRIAQEIPLNITGAGSTNINLSGAVLASVIGTVTTNVLTNVSQGIPINPSNISTEVNIALGNLQTNIPAQILGATTSVVSSVISNALGGLINGSVPILPSNLSLSLAGSVAGIGINISANLAQNLIPSFQLQALLPANLQNAIPRIPTRLTGGPPNPVQVNRSTAQEVSPNDSPRTPPEETESPLDKLKGNRLYGTLPLSEHYKVADLTTNTRLCKATYYRGTPKLTVPEIYENLKFLAENVLERVRKEFPGMYINCGLRTPRPKGKDTSYHNRGLAVDLQWDSPNFSSMANRANWIYNNIPALKELLLETKSATHGGSTWWIHVAVVQGYSGEPKAETWYVGAGKKIPYNNGFVKGAP